MMTPTLWPELVLSEVQFWLQFLQICLLFFVDFLFNFDGSMSLIISSTLAPIEVVMLCSISSCVSGVDDVPSFVSNYVLTYLNIF